MKDRPGEVTDLLEAIAKGEEDALKKLFTLLYGELKALAHSAMKRERRGHTIQATDLVGELYLKYKRHFTKDLTCRAHFIASAARAMRYLLVDYFRKNRLRLTHNHLNIDDGQESYLEMDLPEFDFHDLGALEESIQKFKSISGNERKAQILELTCFLGWTQVKTAKVLGLSRATVQNDLTYAKTWIRREMRKRGRNGTGKESAD